MEQLHGPAVCMQFSFYLELGQISQIKGSVLHIADLAPDPATRLGGGLSQVTCISDQLAIYLGVPVTSSDLILC